MYQSTSANCVCACTTGILDIFSFGKARKPTMNIFKYKISLPITNITNSINRNDLVRLLAMMEQVCENNILFSYHTFTGVCMTSGSVGCVCGFLCLFYKVTLSVANFYSINFITYSHNSDTYFSSYQSII